MEKYVILTKKGAKTSTLRRKPESLNSKLYDHCFELELPKDIAIPDKIRTKKPIQTMKQALEFIKELFEG